MDIYNIFNYVALSFTVICDSFFIAFYFLTRNKNEKPNFMQRCFVNLVIANLFRDILNIVQMAVTPSYYLTCMAIDVIFGIFRVCESFLAAVLGYALLYQVVKIKTVQSNTPCEKLITYIAYSISILINICWAAIENRNSCNTTLYTIFVNTPFLLTLLFNTCVFLYLVHYIRTHATYKSDSFSLLFYAIIFAAFGYLRFPFIVCSFYKLSTNSVCGSQAISSICSFLSQMSGGIISIILSYNLGYCGQVVDKIKKPCKKEIEEK